VSRLVTAALLLVPGLGTAVAQDAPEREGLVLRAAGAFAGYTLVAPLRSTTTYLLDMDGAVVHEWPCRLRPGNSVYLLDDGSLLRCCRVGGNPTFRGGGQGGCVQRIAWDGSMLWNYVHSSAQQLQHHDIEPLPDGNVLLIVWEHVSRADALAAGRDARELTEAGLWPDAVLEVRPSGPESGEVVWEWHAWDHLIQDVDEARPNHGDVGAHPERIDVNGERRTQPATAEEPARERELAERLAALGYGGDDDDDDDDEADAPRRGRGGPESRADWLHTNSIDYDPALDQIVLSSRRWSEVWVIDHSTTTAEARGSTGGRAGRGGDLLYRWGNPQRHGARGAQTLFGQHDAQWIPAGCPGAGRLLLFNNGQSRPGGRNYSSVDELALPLDDEGRYAPHPYAAAAPSEPCWSYGDAGSARFYSGHISGAQRLPNGNTLVCCGEEGRVFEVTAGGALVWDWRNPLRPDAAPDEPRAGGGAGRERPRARPGGGPGGGPGGPRALFRATRVALDHPGVARLAEKDE
jgi:hypothetical protein